MTSEGAYFLREESMPPRSERSRPAPPVLRKEIRIPPWFHNRCATALSRWVTGSISRLGTRLQGSGPAATHSSLSAYNAAHSERKGRPVEIA